jgi:hypothetical protein
VVVNIGGLERLQSLNPHFYWVHHHIGGLENINVWQDIYLLVHHHIGGLEITSMCSIRHLRLPRFDCYFKLICARPLPTYGVPGGMSNF